MARSSETSFVPGTALGEPADDHVTSAPVPDVPVPTTSNNLRCPECNREFKNLRGLGVHRQSKHPKEFHAEKLSQHKEVKVRWTKNEEARMAQIEAQIMFVHPDTYRINQEILAKLPERTLGSIKGKRRNQEYKALVAQLLNQMKNEEVNTEESTEESTGENVECFEDVMNNFLMFFGVLELQNYFITF